MTKSATGSSPARAGRSTAPADASIACRRDTPGRTGVFEVLRITRELRPLIAAGRPTGELRDTAVQAGLLDLRRAALLKVARGQTNAEEVLRAIPPEDLGLDE